MSIIANLTKSKKPNFARPINANLAKSERSNLAKPKKSDFAKTNSFKASFFTSKIKKAFRDLREMFTVISIFKFYDLQCHIWIESNTLKYIISKVLNPITLNQDSSNHVIYKNHFAFSRS